jgi:hypothetical protein
MIPRARRDLPQKRGQQPPAAAALFTLTLVAATVLRLVSPPEAETIEQALARAYTNNPQGTRSAPSSAKPMKACRKRCPAIAQTFPRMLRSAGNIPT